MRALKRFVRAVAASAVSAGIVFALSHVEALSDVVVSIVRNVTGPLPLENEKTIALLVVAVLSAVLQAADKAARDAGLYRS